MKNPQQNTYKQTKLNTTLKYTMIKWNLMQKFKNSSTSTNQQTWYTLHWQNELHKSSDHLNACRKSLWQNSAFTMKALHKVNMEGKHFNIIKPYMASPQLTCYSNMKAFLSKSGRRQRCLLSLTMSLQHSPSQRN